MCFTLYKKSWLILSLWLLFILSFVVHNAETVLSLNIDVWYQISIAFIFFFFSLFLVKVVYHFSRLCFIKISFSWLQQFWCHVSIGSTRRKISLTTFLHLLSSGVGLILPFLLFTDSSLAIFDLLLLLLLLRKIWSSQSLCLWYNFDYLFLFFYWND